MEKTRLTHIDEGVDFLGWRIQRRKKKGTDGKNQVHTYPSKKSLASIKDKIKVLTRRAAHRTLDDLLRRINPLISGWCDYFQHGVSKRTFSYGDHFAFRRIGLVEQAPPKLSKHTVVRRFLPGWEIRADGIEFFRAWQVPRTRSLSRNSSSYAMGERIGVHQMESGTLRNGHVRFEGRAGKPISREAERAPRSDPCTYCRT